VVSRSGGLLARWSGQYRPACITTSVLRQAVYRSRKVGRQAGSDTRYAWLEPGFAGSHGGPGRANASHRQPSASVGEAASSTARAAKLSGCVCRRAAAVAQAAKAFATRSGSAALAAHRERRALDDLAQHRALEEIAVGHPDDAIADLAASGYRPPQLISSPSDENETGGRGSEPGPPDSTVSEEPAVSYRGAQNLFSSAVFLASNGCHSPQPAVLEIGSYA
jgi:hypothetical protein